MQCPPRGYAGSSSSSVTVVVVAENSGTMYLATVDYATAIPPISISP
jgi:hypothetical protein